MVVALLSEVADLKQLVAAQADEIARLKDLNQRPKIKPGKPSGIEKARQARSKGLVGRLGRGPKRMPRVAVEDRVCRRTFRLGRASRATKIIWCKIW